ncbi:uncharacterized protein LOC134222226 [Armigeres subalbatus]|uniref:uncharacterized protein LOC134222226 n=1 Tax=Armigeres subalbatus TaxID=124917 RepID=UPI002ED05D1F
MDIEDLEHLIRINHKIDASDPNFYRCPNSTRNEIHHVEAEESNNGYSEEEDNPVQMIQRVQRNIPKSGPAQKEPHRSLQVPEQRNSAPIACWNCHKVNVLGTDVIALLDSGAAISVLSSVNLLETHGLKILKSNVRICTADDTKHTCLGYVNIPYTLGNLTKVIPTLIVPEIRKTLILGMDFWRAFKIRPMVASEDNAKDLELTWTSTSEGNEINHLRVEPESAVANEEMIVLSVQCVNPLEPQIVHRSKPEEDESLDVPTLDLPEDPLKTIETVETEHVLTEEERQQFEEVLKIFPLTSAGNLGKTNLLEHDIELASDGKMRDLPMYRLQKAKYFSIVDLKDAYFQIPLKESCRNFTAFRTPKGLFRFKVVPFGLKNAPFTMNRLMNLAIGFDLEPFVFIYLDDIIIATESLQEHFRLLKEVALRLRKAGLTISVEKSRFCRKQVKYLGYLLTENGLSIDSAKLEPILNYPRPKSIRDIRRLMGLMGFYQKFIPRYSHLTAPITDLLKRSKKFKWSEEADLALEELKSVLTSAPVLANPDYSRPFIIETDASQLAVGAALIQQFDNEKRIIAYYSKKLSCTQRKYAATEKECLAVLLAVENFRHYIEGTTFTVITDCRSITWLFTKHWLTPSYHPQIGHIAHGSSPSLRAKSQYGHAGDRHRVIAFFVAIVAIVNDIEASSFLPASSQQKSCAGT